MASKALDQGVANRSGSGPDHQPAQMMNQTQAAKRINPSQPLHRSRLVVPPGLMIQLSL